LGAFFLLNYIFKNAFTFLVILYFMLAPAFIFPALKMHANFINKEYTLDYYGVLELWNIDTFEGGSVGRTTWLEARSIEFERQNPGTFILVRNMTKEQAILNLENGNKPTLISYGIGFGDVITSSLTNYTGLVQVRDDLLKGGMVNGNLFAIPYILGGYALIGNEHFMQKSSEDGSYDILENVFDFNTTSYNNHIYSLSYGANVSNNPGLALALNTQKTAEDNQIDENIFDYDSYDAYEKYVNGNSSSVLLGTQRDVYRCKNREANNNMEPNSYNFLEGFSDLIQYISIFKTDPASKYMSERFIEYLTSEQAQRTLSRISMFSTLNLKIYSDIFYREWEKVLNKPLKTFNVFLHNQNLKEKNKTTFEALMGDNDSREKINSWF
jgi:hypothetical protein